ncbi:unnamed protein product, partial [Didymodactylos carnosus]
LVGIISGPNPALVNVLQTFSISYTIGTNYNWSSNLSPFTMTTNGAHGSITFDTTGVGLVYCSYTDRNGVQQERSYNVNVTGGKNLPATILSYIVKNGLGHSLELQKTGFP